MQIEINCDNSIKTITAQAGKSLLEQLREAGFALTAACGGRGKCGKCRVQMTAGATAPTGADRELFSQEKLAAGWRLACLSYPTEDCRVVLPFGEQDFAVVADYGRSPVSSPVGGEAAERESSPVSSPVAAAGDSAEAGGLAAAGDGAEVGGLAASDRQPGSCVLGIDIGTTTLAIQLVETDRGRVLHTVTGLNHQRVYGADVISRIQAANEGHLEELRDCIREDLYRGVRRLFEEYPLEPGCLSRIAIAANTTMEHLLLGYSCQGLGVYPFTPVSLETVHTTFGELFAAQIAREQEQNPGEEPGRMNQVEVVVLPGISTYVGADIAAGLLHCGFFHQEKPCVLIDLGTNGEMAVGTREKLLVTSTAAGPAFEGGNITWGMGSVPGAISGVKLKGETPTVTTIGSCPPVGLCGTGVIETVYELWKAGLIDESGMLEEAYFEEGFPLAKTPSGETIVFTQKDVREIQLAKSAIRAGLETLLKRYGVTPEEIDKVYLAGGFGYQIDLEKAVAVGMLPEAFQNKTVAVGNSSLGGAVDYLGNRDAAGQLAGLIGVSRELELATDTEFNQLYTEYMFFE